MPAAFASCPKCSDYARRRMPVVGPAIRRTATEIGEAPMFTAARFFAAVHKRHTNGGSL